MGVREWHMLALTTDRPERNVELSQHREVAMSSVARVPDRDDPFTRRLIYEGDISLVESRCSRCGALIVGSVTESLYEDETAHLTQCPGVAPPYAA